MVSTSSIRWRVRDASSKRAKMDAPKFTERIATERNCAPELVRAIVTDCLTALHESTVKYGIGTALVGAYWELAPLPAWHFGGILAKAAECDPGELIEHYKRLPRWGGSGASWSNGNVN
jgi:hypothetical protein